MNDLGAEQKTKANCMDSAEPSLTSDIWWTGKVKQTQASPPDTGAKSFEALVNLHETEVEMTACYEYCD